MDRRTFNTRLAYLLLLATGSLSGRVINKIEVQESEIYEQLVEALLPVEKTSLNSDSPYLIKVLRDTITAVPSSRYLITQFGQRLPLHVRRGTSQLEAAEKTLVSLFHNDVMPRYVNQFLDEFYRRVIFVPEVSELIFPQGLFKIGQLSPDWQSYDKPPTANTSISSSIELGTGESGEI